jgi:hypothetical protein
MARPRALLPGGLVAAPHGASAGEPRVLSNNSVQPASFDQMGMTEPIKGKGTRPSNGTADVV